VAVYAQRGARVVRSTSTKALEPRNLNNQGTTGVAADTLKKIPKTNSAPSNSPQETTYRKSESFPQRRCPSVCLFVRLSVAFNCGMSVAAVEAALNEILTL